MFEKIISELNDKCINHRIFYEKTLYINADYFEFKNE